MQDTNKDYYFEIYQRLTSNGFIYSQSKDHKIEELYNELTCNFSEYEDYFRKIHISLKRGNGYFYFSRDETNQQILDKLRSFIVWIDYLELLVEFNPTFGPGTTFTEYQLEAKVNGDSKMQKIVANIFTEYPSTRERLDSLIDLLERRSVIEKIDEVNNMYRVTNVFKYFETVIESIKFKDEENDGNDVARTE